MGCLDCPYNGDIEVPYEGLSEAKIAVVGEAPGNEERKQGRPFIGESGKVLNALLRYIGQDRDHSSLAILNSAKCRLKKESTKTDNAALTCCREFLEEALYEIQPFLIITLGGVALQQILRKKKISENRGRFFESEEFGCQVFCTYHPAYVLRGKSEGFPHKPVAQMLSKEQILFNDFARVGEFLEHSDVPHIDTARYTKALVNDIPQGRVIAIDFETINANTRDPVNKVLSMSLSVKPGVSKVLLAKNGRLPKAALNLLQNHQQTKVVAGRPFDENVCRHLLSIEPGGEWVDIFTLAHIWDETAPVYNLETVTSIYTRMGPIKHLAEGYRENLVDAPEEVLIQYNGVDTDATLRVFNTLVGKYKDKPERAKYFAKVVRPAQDMFSEVEQFGMKIDTEILRINESELNEDIERLHSEAIELLPSGIAQKHEGKGLSLTRPKLIKDYLFDHPEGALLKAVPGYVTGQTKEPQTSEEHLKHFSDDPFVERLLEWKKLHKVASTYVKGLWENLAQDGRIYPTAKLDRTVTGRTVFLNPAIQQIPQRHASAKYIKEAIVSDNGWLLGARDAAQSEMRIAGWFSGDPNIMGALKNGIDLHTKTAMIISGLPLEQITKVHRDPAKTVNFGFIYGMSAKKFQKYAKDKFDLVLSLGDCYKYRELFFSHPDGYYMLPQFYSSVENQLNKYGYIDSILGRRRHLPGIFSSDNGEYHEAIRQGINFPIQSFSSDLCLIAMHLFWEEVKKTSSLHSGVKPSWFIHDSVLFQARERIFNKVMQLLQDCFESRAPQYIKDNFGIEIGYPVESDGKVGTSWANMEDF